MEIELIPRKVFPILVIVLLLGILEKQLFPPAFKKNFSQQTEILLPASMGATTDISDDSLRHMLIGMFKDRKYKDSFKEEFRTFLQNTLNNGRWLHDDDVLYILSKARSVRTTYYTVT